MKMNLTRRLSYRIMSDLQSHATSAVLSQDSELQRPRTTGWFRAWITLLLERKAAERLQRTAHTRHAKNMSEPKHLRKEEGLTSAPEYRVCLISSCCRRRSASY